MAALCAGHWNLIEKARTQGHNAGVQSIQASPGRPIGGPDRSAACNKDGAGLATAWVLTRGRPGRARVGAANGKAIYLPQPFASILWANRPGPGSPRSGPCTPG